MVYVKMKLKYASSEFISWQKNPIKHITENLTRLTLLNILTDLRCLENVQISYYTCQQLSTTSHSSNSGYLFKYVISTIINEKCFKEVLIHASIG